MQFHTMIQPPSQLSRPATVASWKRSQGRLHTSILPTLKDIVDLDSYVKNTEDYSHSWWVCVGWSRDRVRRAVRRISVRPMLTVMCLKRRITSWPWFVNRLVAKLSLFAARNWTLIALAIADVYQPYLNDSSFLLHICYSWTPRPSGFFHISGVDKTISPSVNGRLCDCKSSGNFSYCHTFFKSFIGTPSGRNTNSYSLNHC